MKVSDYISRRVVELGGKQVFMATDDVATIRRLTCEEFESL
jgi:hypothetical protein